MDLRIALLGCGHVGQAFITLAAAKEAELRERYDLRLRFTGGLTRSAGGWVAPAGVSAAMLAAADWPRTAGSAAALPGARAFAEAGTAFAASCPADVLIELTPLDPLTGEPATSHIRAALEARRHVVTANKGPIAHAYRALRQLARDRGVALRFESTVMDGAPLLNLAEFTLPATRIERLRGVLNSTSNYVLHAMAGGASLEAAVERARALGIAEVNPAYDVDGWDGAVKATVLANVLLGADLRPADVAREGLGAEAMRAAQAALPADHTLKQLVEVERTPRGAVVARVCLRALPASDPLAHLAGMETAVMLTTDTMGALTLIEGEGGPGQTAFGVLADLITIARDLSAPPGPPASSTPEPAADEAPGTAALERGTPQ